MTAPERFSDEEDPGDVSLLDFKRRERERASDDGTSSGTHGHGPCPRKRRCPTVLHGSCHPNASLIVATLALVALAACATASGETLPQAKATFRACLLHNGAVKVTLPRGANADGHFWFRRPVRTRWDKHSGWWGISVTTVNGHRYYTAAYQVGGMSRRERHTLKRCADRI